MSRDDKRGTISRLRDIAQIATKHGFGYVFRRGGSGDASDDRSTRAVRLREMFEELGPTFVKFGQLLSTRPDLVPQDIIVELRRLQDSARPEPFEAIRGVVEDDLGLTLEQAFEWFDEEPIGSASVGQVHVAGLPGGQPGPHRAGRAARHRPALQACGAGQGSREAAVVHRPHQLG